MKWRRIKSLWNPKISCTSRCFCCLGPSGWVYGQNQKFALCNRSRQGMQNLHPGGQESCLRNQDSVHGGRRPEGYGQPENCAGDDQQCETRREGSALLEDPRHSVFERVMHGFFESLVAYRPPEP